MKTLILIDLYAMALFLVVAACVLALLAAAWVADARHRKRSSQNGL